MTIDPNSLLIFKIRAVEPTTTAKEAAHVEQLQANEKKLPVLEKPKLLGIFKPIMSKEPAVITAKQQAQQAAKQPVKNMQAAQNQQQIQMAAKNIQKGQQHANAAIKPKIDMNVIGMEIFSTRQEKSEAQQPKRTYAKQKSSAQKEKSGTTIGVYSDKIEYITKSGGFSHNNQLNREVAKEYNCVWHPWRKAYAICSYCHRTFCYEDTIEFNRNYYCLEDIDGISTKYEQKASSKNGITGTAAAVLLMIAFIVYFYFANVQVLYILQYINKVSLIYFIGHVNYSYLLALIESILLLMGFSDAILLLIQSKAGFFTGVFICLASITLFSFQLINTTTIYLGIVDAIIFAAFVLLLYSRSVSTAIRWEDQQLQSPTATAEENLIKWPSAGRF